MPINFALLTEVQDAREVQTVKRQHHFEDHLRSAVSALQRFQQEGHAREHLFTAVTELREALRFQRSRVEPYAYLAWAMFAVGQLQLGCTYLKIAREIAPAHPLVTRICRSL